MLAPATLICKEYNLSLKVPLKVAYKTVKHLWNNEDDFWVNANAPEGKHSHESSTAVDFTLCQDV